jgi:hypothetical protein
MEGQGTQRFHILGKSVYICCLYYFTLRRLHLKVQATFEPALILTGHLILPIFMDQLLISKSPTFSSNTIT